MKIDSYSIPEEVINSLTHCIGIYISLILSTILCYSGYLEGLHIAKLASLAVYGFSMTMMFTMSSAYHCIQYIPAKQILKKLDHISIYIAICGFYAPCCMFMIMPVNYHLGVSVLVAEGTLGICGVVFKLFMAGKYKFISTFSYLFMGWLGAVCFNEIAKASTTEMLVLLASSGAAYTIGCIFYLNKNIKYFHCIWHVFVLIGTILNFCFIFKIA